MKEVRCGQTGLEWRVDTRNKVSRLHKVMYSTLTLWMLKMNAKKYINKYCIVIIPVLHSLIAYPSVNMLVHGIFCLNHV